jgi:HD-GYP domain-containing protein (c-di-GMP phosphodiesterase class II)
MNKEHVRIIYEAALLHDIGKISIPEHILTKNGALTSQEYEIMKTHVNSSIEMIRHLPSMDYVIPAVIGHHERWDGKGYPRGIARENIPLSARCLAIADAFDAMTTNRSYRKALPVEYAAEEIIKNAGTQFDPELASIFADLIKSKEITVENQLSLSI